MSSYHDVSTVGDSSTTGSTSSSKSSVAFSTAYVREYERVLEGRPDVPMALTLGWDYREQEPMSVDEFQKCKHSPTSASSSMSSGSYVPQTSIQQRFTILHFIHGFTIQELQEAEALRIRSLEQEAEDKKGQKPASGIFHKFKGLVRRKGNGKR
jgi:hypothetical protein